jgi:hypothetical protein
VAAVRCTWRVAQQPTLPPPAPQVISASSDATVRVWDAKTCECIQAFRWGRGRRAAAVQAAVAALVDAAAYLAMQPMSTLASTPAAAAAQDAEEHLVMQPVCTHAPQQLQEATAGKDVAGSQLKGASRSSTSHDACHVMPTARPPPVPAR